VADSVNPLAPYCVPSEFVPPAERTERVNWTEGDPPPLVAAVAGTDPATIAAMVKASVAINVVARREVMVPPHRGVVCR
jgi:hypothetical protein